MIQSVLEKRAPAEADALHLPVLTRCRGDGGLNRRRAPGLGNVTRAALFQDRIEAATPQAVRRPLPAGAGVPKPGFSFNPEALRDGALKEMNIDRIAN